MDEKRFGFIEGEDRVEYFFHATDFNGHYNDLVEDVKAGQRIEVDFSIVPSLKGPRAGNVVRTDGGISATDFGEDHPQR